MNLIIFINQRVDCLKWSKSHLALISLLFLGLTFNTFGQLEPGYSMYRFNPQVISPSHAGSTKTGEVILMNRQQWEGIEGSPSTYIFSGNLKIGKQSGIGANGMLDQFGPTKITSLSVDYAYHAKLTEKWVLSSGFRLGYTNLALNFNETNLYDQGDPNYVNRSIYTFNTGWGIKIAKGDGLFISVSQPRILRYDLGPGFKDVALFYGMVGTKVEANSTISIYPSALFRVGAGVPVSWDANVLVNFLGKFDIGSNYRYQDSWGVRTGIKVSKSLYVGYVFEMPTTQASRVNLQSHEIALRYSLKK
jgi:type IX secretion system PorP/SprF family membrane protein